MLDEAAREDLIDRIMAIFTNEAEAGEFAEDPDAYVEEHLPEGTEAADVHGALPEVGYRTGLDFSNVAQTGGSAGAAGQISHTYNTVYQQNSFIYAEEGAQVTNVQGDGNAVAQQDIDLDVDYGQGEVDEDPVEPQDGYEAPEHDDHDPMEPGYEQPEDEHQDPWAEDAPEDPGYEAPVDEPWNDDLPEDHGYDAPEAPAAEAYEAPEPLDADPVDDMAAL